jgi:hypothetical protein
MAGHRCQCPHCAPEAFPPEVRAAGRTGPGHFGARFGRQDWMLTPYLNGMKVDRCLEALAGLEGWVTVASMPVHICHGCSWGLCQEVRRGAVEVRGTLGPDGRMRAEGDAA